MWLRALLSVALEIESCEVCVDLSDGEDGARLGGNEGEWCCGDVSVGDTGAKPREIDGVI